MSAEKKLAIIKTAQQEGVHYQSGEPLAKAAEATAAAHGVSKLQVAQVLDEHYSAKKKYSWEKPVPPNKIEKLLYKGAKSSAAAKDPLSLESISTVNLEKLGSSEIGHVPQIQKQTVVDAAKTQYLSTYQDDKTAYKTIEKLGQHLGFSPHQTAKILDEADAAKSGGVNKHLYEQKILKLAKTSTLPKAEKVYGSSLTHGSYHLVSPPKNTTAKPGTKHAEIAPHAAAAMQKQMLATHGAWTPAQESALSTYTSSYYKQMNGYLRSGGTKNAGPGVKQKVAELQSAMKPIPHDLILHRGADHLGFGVPSHKDVPSLVGKTYEDRGFLSTSVGGHAAFGGSVQLTIRAPKGTHAAYVGSGMTNSQTGKALSHFGHENEVILAAGTKYKVVSVEAVSPSTWAVTVEVVGD